MDISQNKRFKEVRLLLKLSQVVFAKEINLKQGTVSDIERCRIGVTQKVAQQLFSKLSVNSTWFYTGKENPFIGHIINNSFIVNPDKKKEFEKAKTTILKKVGANIEEYKKLENVLVGLQNSNKDREEFFKATTEIANFIDSFNNLFDKYFSIYKYIEMPENDLLKKVEVVKRHIEELKVCKPSFIELSKAIKKFNSNMHKAGYKDFTP